MNALPRCTGIATHAERATRRFALAAAVMAVVTLCLLALAGCGGSDEPTPEPAPPAGCISQCSPCEQPCRGVQ